MSADKNATEFTFLGGQGSGGFWARRGFGFQDSWLVYLLLEWVRSKRFFGAVNEAADDIDAGWHRKSDVSIVPRDPGLCVWHAYQLKNTSLTPTSLKEILRSFEGKHKQFGGEYVRFHIIAARCSDNLSSLPEAIHRVRDLRLSHPPGTKVYNQVFKEFEELVRPFSDNPAFLLDRVRCEFGANWLGTRRHFLQACKGSLSDLLVPAGRAKDVLRELQHIVSIERPSKFISRSKIFNIISRYRQESLPKVASLRDIAVRQTTADLSSKPSISLAVENPEKILAPSPVMSCGSRARRPTCAIHFFPGNTVLLELSDRQLGLLNCGSRAIAGLIPRMISARARLEL